jgi:glycosyltransferase 2 family protein
MTEHAPAGASGHPGRTAALWILKIVVSTGLLYVLLTRVDLHRLWALARTASVGWLAAALGLYLVMVLVSSWRWRLLLTAQHIGVSFRSLVGTYLVATFFNNFLPSNIGGDVIRIRDTSRPAGSKTLATTVVLVDRGIGLLGLVFVAASGATLVARMSAAIGPVGPGLLWGLLGAALAVATPALLRPDAVGRLLRPLRALHQDWVEVRIERLTTALARFRESPRAIGSCFGQSILVQGLLVGFYSAIAHALHLQIPLAHLAIVVPLSFVVQMLPVSVNGFGVREATFGFYFTRLGEPLESALALSFIGAVLIMLFSVSGAVAYVRGRPRPA